MTTNATLQSLFQRADARDMREKRTHDEYYAVLVRRLADGEADLTAEELDSVLRQVGKSREDLTADLRRFETRRSERQRAASLLSVMVAHRAAEREVLDSRAALEEATRLGKERIAQAREAEQRARNERFGAGNLADAVLRLAPEALAAAFTRAERVLIEAEERLEEAKRRGDATEVRALETTHAEAERRAADAWRRVIDHDPAPNTAMRPGQEYRPHPARLI